MIKYLLMVALIFSVCATNSIASTVEKKQEESSTKTLDKHHDDAIKKTPSDKKGKHRSTEVKSSENQSNGKECECKHKRGHKKHK